MNPKASLREKSLWRNYNKLWSPRPLPLVSISRSVIVLIQNLEKMKGKETEFSELLLDLSNSGLELLRSTVSDSNFRGVLGEIWDVVSGNVSLFKHIWSNNIDILKLQIERAPTQEDPGDTKAEKRVHFAEEEGTAKSPAKKEKEEEISPAAEAPEKTEESQVPVSKKLRIPDEKVNELGSKFVHLLNVSQQLWSH